MITPNVGNVSEVVKISWQKSRKAQREAQPPTKASTITNLVELCETIHRFKTYYSLTDASFRVLMLMAHKMITERLAYTSHGVNLRLRDSERNNRSTQMMLRLLQDKGLIEVIGKSKWDANIYAPTTLALRSLGALVQLV